MRMLSSAHSFKSLDNSPTSYRSLTNNGSLSLGQRYMSSLYLCIDGFSLFTYYTKHDGNCLIYI